MCHRRFQFDKLRSIESRYRKETRRFRGINRRHKTVIGRSVLTADRAFWQVSARAVFTSLAIMVVFLRRRMRRSGMMCAVMRQAAHAIARRHVRAVGARQERQRCAQQHQNHQNSLDAAHRWQGNTIPQKMNSPRRKSSGRATSYGFTPVKAAWIPFVRFSSKPSGMNPSTR